MLTNGEQYRLILGDCIEGMAGLEMDSVAHVIADPPYSEHVHAKQWIGHALTAEGAARCATNHTEIGFTHLTLDQQIILASQYARVAQRWTLVFCDIEGISGWIVALKNAGLDYVRTCIWDKVDSSPQFTGDRPASAAEAIVIAHRPGRKRWNGGGEAECLPCARQWRDGRQATSNPEADRASLSANLRLHRPRRSNPRLARRQRHHPARGRGAWPACDRLRARPEAPRNRDRAPQERAEARIALPSEGAATLTDGCAMKTPIDLLCEALQPTAIRACHREQNALFHDPRTGLLRRLELAEDLAVLARLEVLVTTGELERYMLRKMLERRAR